MACACGIRSEKLGAVTTQTCDHNPHLLALCLWALQEATVAANHLACGNCGINNKDGTWLGDETVVGASNVWVSCGRGEANPTPCAAPPKTNPPLLWCSL